MIKFKIRLRQKNNTSQDNKEIKNNNNSFLESSIDNDFYQSLINQTFLQNISRLSFDVNNNNSNKENFEINNTNKMNDLAGNNISEIVKEKLDINSNKKNEKKNELISNINLLLKKKNIKNLDIKENSQNNYHNYIEYLDKKNCLIFQWRNMKYEIFNSLYTNCMIGLINNNKIKI